MNAKTHPRYTESLPACRNKLLHLVAHGCRFYTEGKVGAEKAARVARKFAARRTRTPVHAAFLFEPKEGAFRFWLLTARRENLEAYNEQARDARKKQERLQLAGLELKKLVRLVRHQDGHKESRHTLTWALTRAAKKAWTHNARRYAAHRSPKRANRLLADLARLPGYAGVRAQRRALYREMLAVRKRQQPRAEKLSYPSLMDYWVDPVKFDATGLWTPFDDSLLRRQ